MNFLYFFVLFSIHDFISSFKTDLYILSEKNPYLVNVERMESGSICLETVFISEEFCMKKIVVVADPARYTAKPEPRCILLSLNHCNI